jgi:D-alanyl-D-alanine carboxypeptidase/D-alanyl-D-alanine-endopeptidase (penicillin-binding protein 4)
LVTAPETQPDDENGVEPGATSTTPPVNEATDVVRPGTGVVRPNTGVVRPNTDVVRPNTDVVRPNTDVVRPDTDVVRPNTDVVRPNTDVVRPSTDVVRPGTGVVAPADAAAARARAVVPDAPERPLDPIHIVLPVIPVKPAKQSFLDRLIAPRKKKKKVEPVDESVVEPEPPAEPAAAPSAPPQIPPSPLTPPVPPVPSAIAPPPAGPTAPPSPHSPSSVVRPQQGSATGAARVEPPRVDPTRVERPAAPVPPAPQAPPVPPKPTASAPVVHPPVHPPVVHPPTRTAPPTAPSRTAPPPGAWAPEAPGRRQGRPDRHPDHQPRYQPDRRLSTSRRGDWSEADEYEDWSADDAYRRPIRKGRWLLISSGLTVLATVVGAVSGLMSPAAPGRWVPATFGGAAAPVLPGLASDSPRPSAAGLAARIQSLLADPGLGGHVTASIVDATSGEVLYERDADAAVTPASTAKLATAAAVLHARGPAYQIATRAVAGAEPGEVVLVGGGDPTLAAGAVGSYPGAARLDKLAEQVLKALNGSMPTRIVVDGSLYEGSTFGPGWVEQDEKDGFVANITALMTDGARVNPRQLTDAAARYPQPDLAAGRLFAKSLGLPASAVTTGVAPAGAAQLGVVLSPPIARLVEFMLSESDNVIAETLSRQVALATGRQASFAGGAEATRTVLAQLGVPTQDYGLVDGSGLANANRVSAALLTAILTRAASPEAPELRPVLSGLPVAAWSGTLAPRYRTSSTGSAAAGVVRAKTGTLAGVNALAGIVVDADGRLLAFSIIADATTNRMLAQYAMDRVAAAIAGCGCQ